MLSRLVFVSLCLAAGLSHADGYPIRFHRPAKVGNRQHHTIKVNEENRMMTMVGKNPVQTEEEKYALSLEADVEVLELVNEKESKIKITVTRIECMRNAQPHPVIPVKSTFIAERKADETFFSSLDGKPLSEEAQKVCRMAFSISDGESSEDKAFGTNERKQVGDRWPVNAASATAELRRVGLRVDPVDVKGTVKLDGVVQDHGTECLRIRVEMDIRNLKNLPIPDFIKPTKTAFSCNVTADLPTDLSKDVTRSTEEFSFDFLAYGKVPSEAGEQEISMVGRMYRLAEASYIPLGRP